MDEGKAKGKVPNGPGAPPPEVLQPLVVQHVLVVGPGVQGWVLGVHLREPLQNSRCMDNGYCAAVLEAASHAKPLRGSPDGSTPRMDQQEPPSSTTAHEAPLACSMAFRMASLVTSPVPATHSSLS